MADGDCYTIADMAYMRLVERHGQRTGQLPPNYDRVKADVERELKRAIARIHKMHGGVRVAGRISSAESQSILVQRWGPLVDWDSA